jgi:class 3 adenylate cyclase
MIAKRSKQPPALDHPAATREQVAATVLFADICGSTVLFERYGDLHARQIESQVLDLLTAKTSDFAGTVIKTIGDEIMSRFTDAERAFNAACEMQTAVKDAPSLLEFDIAIKIGLHHGPVLVEHNDLFGDAVNVAARMVSLAKADQIITTQATVRQLPADLAQMTRNLGRSRVRGKQAEIEIVEVIWQEFASMTQVVSTAADEELRSLMLARLILEYGGAEFEVIPDALRFTIGRDNKNDLVVDQEPVSRSHANIECRQGRFVLVDRSTNGTYLLLENGARFFVQRDEFTLHDRGVICLGQAVSEDNPDVIRFRCLPP